MRRPRFRHARSAQDCAVLLRTIRVASCLLLSRGRVERRRSAGGAARRAQRLQGAAHRRRTRGRRRDRSNRPGRAVAPPRIRCRIRRRVQRRDRAVGVRVCRVPACRSGWTRHRAGSFRAVRAAERQAVVFDQGRRRAGAVQRRRRSGPAEPRADGGAMTRRATIRFTAADQKRFARFSGDSNPVHVDPVAARRVVAGEPIVHGIHLLLRALDVHLTRTTRPKQMTVTATFQRPAFLREPIHVESTDDGTVSMEADGDVPLVLAGISTRNSRNASNERQPSRLPSAESPDSATSGAIDLRRVARARGAFPRLVRVLGADVVAALAGISNIVGMKCPGRDSLLSAVRVEVTPHARASQLAWHVARVDDRFGLVRLDVASAALRGTVDAFKRPPPVPLPTIAAATARVAPGEFAGQRALIVGGSRGLGGATAMLLAAGGGLPIVTFATGADEAASLRRDARSSNRSVETFRFNVADDEATRLGQEAARFGVTHLYYYATPRIF